MPTQTHITWRFARGQQVRWAAHPEVPWRVWGRRWEEHLLSASAWYGLAQADGPVVQWAAEADLLPWQG